MGRFPSTYTGAIKNRCRLTADLVQRIHECKDLPTAELARKMGFSPTTIHNVRVGNTWPELHPEYLRQQEVPNIQQPIQNPQYDPGYLATLGEDNPVVTRQVPYTPPPPPVTDPGAMERIRQEAERILSGGKDVRNPATTLGTSTGPVSYMPNVVSYPPDVTPYMPDLSKYKRLPGITLGQEPDEVDDMFSDPI